MIEMNKEKVCIVLSQELKEMIKELANKKNISQKLRLFGLKNIHIGYIN